MGFLSLRMLRSKLTIKVCTNSVPDPGGVVRGAYPQYKMWLAFHTQMFDSLIHANGIFSTITSVTFILSKT